MESIIETINKRYSSRSYSSKVIENDKMQQMKEYLASNTKGPLGSEVRFQIIDATGYEQNELKKLGTYGLIKGPKVFIAGKVKKGNTAMEDFGYCMEKNILMATSIGLGTCWLGGSLNRSTFALKMNAVENEVIPAVTPIGYSGDKKTFTENILRMMVGAKNRRKSEELFFIADINTPLDLTTCKYFATALEAVRIAPSASNKQPWRVVKERNKDSFHFYMKENAFYNNAFKDIKIQNLDIGIAMSHFELSSKELGLEGKWEINKPSLDAGDLKYIVSWVG